jgi:hypothetical protein
VAEIYFSDVKTSDSFTRKLILHISLEKCAISTVYGIVYQTALSPVSVANRKPASVKSKLSDC